MKEASPFSLGNVLTNVMTPCHDSHMTYSELIALHADTDLTDRKARRVLFAAMATASQDDKREFTAYLTERGTQGVAA